MLAQLQAANIGIASGTCAVVKFPPVEVRMTT
jgi:hypothetical protein